MRTLTNSYAKNLHHSRVTSKLRLGWKYRVHQTLGFMMAACAIIVVSRLLSRVDSDTILQMLWGFGGFACALAGLATLLWCVRWGLAWDNEQEEGRIRKAAMSAKNRRA
jgi:hypothetical protein